MAIYHFEMSTVSKDKRSKGGACRNTSTVKKSQYIKREGKYAPKPQIHEKLGVADIGNDQKVADQAKYILREEQFEDRHDDEIVFKSFGHMPKWPKVNPQENDQHYWDACDKYERSNGRTARTFIIAMPRELSDEQRFELAKTFVSDIAHANDGQPLPYSFAIHQDQENHNPHLHIMISERVNDGIARNASSWFKRASPTDASKGGARKTEDLKAKSWLYDSRKRWEVSCNAALERAGSLERIDCRTLKAQGIEREPTLHLGTARHIGETGKNSMTYQRRSEHNDNVKALELNYQEQIVLISKPSQSDTGLGRVITQSASQMIHADRQRFINTGRPHQLQQSLYRQPPTAPQNATTAAWLSFIAKLGEDAARVINQMIQDFEESNRRIVAMQSDLLKLDASRQNYLYTPTSWLQPNGLEQQFVTKHHPTAMWLKPAEPQTFVTETIEVNPVPSTPAIPSIDWEIVKTKAPWLADFMMNNQDAEAKQYAESFAKVIASPTCTAKAVDFMLHYYKESILECTKLGLSENDANARGMVLAHRAVVQLTKQKSEQEMADEKVRQANLQRNQSRSRGYGMEM